MLGCQSLYVRHGVTLQPPFDAREPISGADGALHKGHGMPGAGLFQTGPKGLSLVSCKALWCLLVKRVAC